MDKKKLRNDLILIGSLLLAAVVALAIILSTQFKASKLVAKVYVQNNVVEVIDLSKKEEQEFVISGVKGKVVVHSRNGGIAITSSNCPHQDCVNMGYVNVTNKPIICAYNAVYVIIEGVASNDADI